MQDIPEPQDHVEPGWEAATPALPALLQHGCAPLCCLSSSTDEKLIAAAAVRELGESEQRLVAEATLPGLVSLLEVRLFHAFRTWSSLAFAV